MVAQLRGPTDWRRAGCGDGCELRMVIMPGLLGRQTVEIHDPDAHEVYGRMLAGDVAVRPVLESGPLVLWRREMQLWVDGQEVNLSRTEWRLLLAIIDGNGGVVHAEAILRRVWGDPCWADVHLLRVTLWRLRTRLGPAAGLIVTVEGMGYRFCFLPPGEMPQAPMLQRMPLGARGRWSIKYAACVVCNGTQSRHHTDGLCNACYKRRERRIAALGKERNSSIRGAS